MIINKPELDSWEYLRQMNCGQYEHIDHFFSDFHEQLAVIESDEIFNRKVSSDKVKDLEKRLALAVEGLDYYSSQVNWREPFARESHSQIEDDLSIVEFNLDKSIKYECGGKKAREILAVIK